MHNEALQHHAIAAFSSTFGGPALYDMALSFVEDISLYTMGTQNWDETANYFKI